MINIKYRAMLEYKIRKIKQEDKHEILSMMQEFYSSDAVFTNGSNEIFETDFETCINNSPFLDGYVFYNEEKILGYAMLAKSFSTEFGKICIWIEDLYLKEYCRGKVIIPEFINYLKSVYPDVIFKLEVEEENSHAVHVYKKCGFKELPYSEMIMN